jgi:hypothetical protein
VTRLGPRQQERLRRAWELIAVLTSLQEAGQPIDIAFGEFADRIDTSSANLATARYLEPVHDALAALFRSAPSSGADAAPEPEDRSIPVRRLEKIIARLGTALRRCELKHAEFVRRIESERFLRQKLGPPPAHLDAAFTPHAPPADAGEPAANGGPRPASRAAPEPAAGGRGGKSSPRARRRRAEST